MDTFENTNKQLSVAAEGEPLLNEFDLEKRISDFFKELFCFNKEVNSTLGYETVRLLALIPDEYKSKFHEFYLVLKTAKEYIQEGKEIKLIDIYEKELKNKLHGYPVQAYLSCQFKEGKYEPEELSLAQFEQYKSLTLMVLIRQYLNGDVKSRIPTLCCEIRQIAIGNRTSLVRFLPDILMLTPDELLDELQKLKHNESYTSTKSEMIEKLNTSYSLAFGNKIGSSRDHQVDDEPQYKIQKTRLYLDGNSKSDNYDIEKIIFEEKLKSNRNLEDAKTDTDEALYRIDVNSDDNYEIKYYKAKAIYLQIKINEMKLACSLSNSTKREINILIQECFLTFDYKLSNESILVLISLVLGKTINEIRGFKLAKDDFNHDVGVEYHHQLPKVERYSTPYEKALVDYNKGQMEIVQTFIIPIPKGLTFNLLDLKFQDVSDHDINCFLKIINEKHGIKLNTHKIANYLTQVLVSENISTPIINIIKNEKLDRLAALYYFQTRLYDIVNIHGRYLNFLNNHIATNSLFLNFFSCNSEVPKNVFLGSKLAIHESIVSSILIELKKTTENLLSKKYRYSAECHNTFTAFVLQIVELASCYRPIIGVLGILSDFNLNRKEYLISDKEVGNESLRVIVLADYCVDVLNKYINYVNECSEFYANKDWGIHQRYSQVITSEKHLIFFIDDHKTVEVSPKTIDIYLSSIFPLQPNWHRHYILTLLHKHNIDNSAISAFMGHSELGGRTFTKTSSFCFENMQDIAVCINSHFIDLGIGELKC